MSRSNACLCRRGLRRADATGARAVRAVSTKGTMAGSHRWHQRWSAVAGFLREVYLRFGEDRIALAAGAISFFALLSLVPLLLLAVTFAAPQLNELLDSFRATLGPVYDLLKAQITYLTTPSARLISIPAALVIGLWSGSSIFLIIEASMNLAWHARRKRPFWLRRGIAFLMVLIGGVLLVGAALLTNSIAFLAGLDITFFGRPVMELSWLLRAVVAYVIPALIISTMFAVIYRVMPTKRVTFRAVLPGAVFSGVLWLIALHLLGLYWYRYGAEQRYSLVYGSLTGIFLLMILLYYGSLIFLFGAEISVVYHRRLVEAGNRTERLVEEREQLSGDEERRRREEARRDNADRAMTCYGYQGEDWQTDDARNGDTPARSPLP